MNNNRFWKFSKGAPSIVAHSFLLCVLVVSSGKAAADDTDVFFGSASSSGEARPNVLLVLDTSGSMGSRDGGSTSRLDRMKDAVTQMLESDVDMNIGLMQYNGTFGGGPVLYPVTYLEDVVCAGFDCTTPALTDEEYAVDGDYGDVEETLTGGNVDVDGNTLSLGQSGTYSQALGLRYNDINIARGSTIVEARIELVAKSTMEDAASFIIEVEDVGNADEYSSNSSDVTSRDYGTDSISWVPEEWYLDTLYQTADISALVQDVVSHDDWCSGNALAFNITGSGERQAYSWESATDDGVDYVPKLRIIQDTSTALETAECSSSTLTRPISNSSDDAEQTSRNNSPSLTSLDLDFRSGTVSGVRFRDIDIPKDAVIESASIEFTSLRSETGSISMYIYPGYSVNSSLYYRYSRSWYSGPLNRNVRNSRINWSVPSVNTFDKVSTPDLSAFLQYFVSSSSWSSGNSIEFQLILSSGRGDRSMGTYDAGSQYAPVLTVTYSDGSSGGSGSGGGTTGPVVPEYTTSTARDEMLAIVDDLRAVGGTPGVDSYYEAALYMRGENVKFGKERGVTTSQSQKENYRISHEDSYTGGTVYRDARCTDSNLNSSVCTDEEIVGTAQYLSPIGGSCQANHIVLLSDGDTHGHTVESDILSMVGKASCTETGNGKCATDLATWLNTTDHSSDFDDVQSITTHTIAFNLEGDGKDFLERVAYAGGGSAYEAESTDDLIAVFDDIATKVADVDTGFTAPAATVNQFNRLTHREDIYFALFKPEATPLWQGNIKQYRLGVADDGTGDVLIRDRDGFPAIDSSTGYFADHARSFWPEVDDTGGVVASPDGSQVARGGVANQLELTGLTNIGARRVYTWTGDPSVPLSTSVDLTAVAQKLHESNSAITSELLGIDGQGSDSAEQAQLRSDLIKWARGVDVKDVDEDGNVTDIRRQMGDPMHSRPVIVNYATTDADSVRSILYVGTNEGYLHAFDTETGEEQFSFVPGELLKNLDTFYTNSASLHRTYGLDGPLSVWRDDTNDNLTIDSGDTAYLFAGMRRGGNSFYALDITNPDSPELAWTIQGGSGGTAGFESMGQSWSRLTPVKMFINGAEKDVLIFGGGYDLGQDELSQELTPGIGVRTHSTDDVGTGIYIVEAATGSLLWSGLGESSGTEFFSAMEYGFNANIRAIDINRDDYVDQIYAADAGGQLWRFDVTQNHQGNMDTLIDGGVIADFSSTAASGHRRFYNEPDVALIESGGQRFLTVSIGSGARANPLDEVIQDRFYMVRQYAVYEAPAVYGKSTGGSSSTPITESDLVDVSNTASPLTNEYGWYLDFSSSGEKVLGASVTFDEKVFFSSYVPTEQANFCSPEIGSGRAYIMDVVSGAPVIDLHENDSATSTEALTVEDRSTDLNRGGIPPEAMVLISEDALDEPQILFGAEQLDVGINNSTRRTFWSDQGESGEIIISVNEED